MWCRSSSWVLPALGYTRICGHGVGSTTAANSALITAATPVSTMLLCAAVGSDTLSRAKVLGGTIAFSGAVGVVLATHGIGFSGASLGDLLTFLSDGVLGSLRGLWHSDTAGATRRFGWRRGQSAWDAWECCRSPSGRRPPSILRTSIPHPWAPPVLRAAAGRGGQCADVRSREGPRSEPHISVPVHGAGLAVMMAAIFLGESIVVGQLLGGAVIVLGILVSRSQLPGRRHPQA